ncbi:hypothetical protein D3C76_25940 [compost metagenome]
MPSYYSKPQLQVLLELINEANPGLLELRDLENSRFGVPTPYTPKAGEIADTQLELYATPASFYTGKRIVYYRRINIATLFKNMQLDIDYWLAGNMGKAELIMLLNERHGLSLIDTDLATGAISEGASRSITMSGTSVVYAPASFLVRWTKGKRELDKILTKDKYDSLYWDANYVEGKPLMNLVGMGIDNSRFAGAKGIPNGTVIGAASGQVREMADWFSAYTGLTIDVRVDHTLQGGLSGLRVTRFTLPDASLPEANAAKFNRALVITPVAASWFSGKIIWHYNE